MTGIPDRILRLPKVLTRTRLSRSTLYRKLDNGTFPKRVHISMRCIGWHDSTIVTWLRNRAIYHVDDQR
ncbi:AlpA family phage regulatory protein [Sphingomonas sp. S1-29]|uniref:helix-turn-helix transcriptional regulator n=1 Tax=Sphingomonas sp. S1-29 TaxID=2991074 RepID=UPI00223EAB61|nr:AlpA family phage regulatory protein [Sphingomonas sp. S1-29]UZK69767.1 AlpA family phage regulatory protein [Sphingomonas sp. S1-29]